MADQDTITRDGALNSLLDMMANPSAMPSDELLAELRDRYPYLTLGDELALLRGGAEMTEASRARLMARVTLGAAGPDSVLRVTGHGGGNLAGFYPPVSINDGAAGTTDSAIDRFLETYGNTDERETALLERMIFNPVPDYTAVLERESQESGNTATPAPEAGSQDALLDAFLDKQAAAPATPEPETPKPETPKHDETKPEEPKPEEHRHDEPRHKRHEPQTVPLAVPSAGSSLSASLAKIYIRQHRYDKAYEIIRGLSLNNPEKSAYFADQLRFLRKLMLIESHKRL